MIRFGTIINIIAIISGGILGLFFKKEISKKIQDSMMISIGLCIIFIGITGVTQNIQHIQNYTMMMVISLILGTIIGETIDFD